MLGADQTWETDLQSAFESEAVWMAEADIEEPAGLCGSTCKVQGVASQGLLVKTSCEGTYVVAMFCYASRPGCELPEIGDEVCLDRDLGQGPPWAVEAQCINDPCCIPCPPAPEDSVEPL